MQELKKPKSSFFWLALLTSSTTLVCCALPALFIALGAGAALASLLTAVPQLVWISQYKVYFFAATAMLLLIGGVMMMRPAACPADKALALACARTKRMSRALYLIACTIFLVGVWAAYLR